MRQLNLMLALVNLGLLVGSSYLDVINDRLRRLIEDAEPQHARSCRLSFAGIMDAEPDLAARSEDVLRTAMAGRIQVQHPVESTNHRP